MDLIPKPDQVVSAASNLARTVRYGGVADLRPMPRTLVDDGELREVHHYRPATRTQDVGDPVLLVTPLAAPSLCFDLRRGCSLVEHLVGDGRPTYVVEYGEISFRNRNLDMAPWVDDVVPTAVRAVSEHAGGRPLHLVGWSLGGIFALLVAADRNDLPIASITVLGSPVDLAQVPIVAPMRPLLDLSTGHSLVTRTVRAFGAPTPAVGWALQLASVQRMVTKPLAVAAHLDDADWLAQVEAVDRFTEAMSAYPGRTFGQLYHRFIKGNALADGAVEVGTRTISLADVEVPVHVFAGATDTIAPIGSVEPLLGLLTGAPETAFEVVPGGHLGLLTGRGARETTWPTLDTWLDRWSAAEEASPQGGSAARRRKASAADTIGSNPRRRYGSQGSRALSR